MNIFVPKTYKPKWKRVPWADDPTRPHPIPYDYNAFLASLMGNPLDLRFVRDEPKHIHLPLGASLRKG